MKENSQANLRYVATKCVGLLLVAWLAGLSGTRTYGVLVTWTGSGSNDNWSTVANWDSPVLPEPSDFVRFSTDDSPSINFIDIDFSIAELQYVEDGTHTTYINPSVSLNISDDLSIGRETGTSMSTTADGSLILSSNSSLNVGTATAPAAVNIGLHEYSNISFGYPGSATGLLDATQGTADFHLSDLYVGQGIDLWGGSTATGTLITGQGSTIATTNANVGTGSSATGIVNMNGGLLAIGNDLWIGRKTGSGSGPADGSLTLGSSSSLHVGTSTAPAVVNIGINQSGSGDATGLLDATQGTAYLYLTELNVGRKSGSGGTATGTLKWNQSVALHADEVYFGRGKGTGYLDVPTGGTFLLGTAADPVSRLAISYNDTIGVGASNADLDFTGTDPFFEAYIGGDLSIGRVAGWSMSATANGSLTLGSNSTLHVGTATAPAVVNIGMYEYSNTSYGSPGSATGLLDATQGTADFHLSELNVGRGDGLWAGTTATGTLRWSQPNPLYAEEIYFGRGGSSTGILDVPAGGTFLLGDEDNPVSLLAISYNDTFGQGTSNAHLDFTVTDPTFEAHIGGDLSIGRKMSQSGADSADGSLTLGSHSTLYVGTSTAPAVVNIGTKQSGSGDATGLLDATQGTAYLYLTELNVGRKSGSGGTATGTLKWNQSVALHADEVYFGRGKGTGYLDVPTGGTFLLGTAADPVSRLAISYNDTIGVGASNADLDFTGTDPFFEAYIGGDLSIGRVAGWSMSATANGSLTLGSNSTLHVGTATAPAVVNIGMYEYSNTSYGSPGSATGLLDATQGTADFHLSELNVGRGDGLWAGSTATGTLLTGPDSTIATTNANVGMGPNATGIVNMNGGLLSIGNDLSIGRKTGSGSGPTDGSLTLGSSSTLNVGTTATPAVVNIGINQSGSGDATGLLDATQGTADFHLSELNVGRGYGLWASRTARGTLKTGSGSTISATTVNVGTGTNATGTVNMDGGLFAAETINIGAGGTFNFKDGRLGIGTFNTFSGSGSLDQQRGTLAPGYSPFDTSLAGIATINGDYRVTSDGTLEIELFGLNPGTEYDQVFVKGLVDLNSDLDTGGFLDVILGFAPKIGDDFTILHNDEYDLINGFFAGLPEGAVFYEEYLGISYPFQISYVGYTGNDVVITTVPVPGAVLLGSIGLALAGWKLRRREEL